MGAQSEQPKLIAWGSYDKSKPRVRLLLESLRTQGGLAAEINIPAWADIRDKSVAGTRSLLKVLLRLLISYPGALMKLLKYPASNAVLLPYPAIPDIFVIWPVAALRRQKIIFDAFISFHDTLAGDRAMISPTGLRARLIWRIERLALRLADIILVDTDQHGDFFASHFRLARNRFQTVLVGAEPGFWAARDGATRAASPVPAGERYILFYGQLSPLHGIEAILEAIRLTETEPFHWLLIGSGQDEPKLRAFLAAGQSDKVHWLPWIDYDQLPAIIRSASVALGVFGKSDKAGRVIPNKVFQILAAGTPVVTRAGAVDLLAERFSAAVITVPPGDAAAIVEAIGRLLTSTGDFQAVPKTVETELGPAPGVQALLVRLAT